MKVLVIGSGGREYAFVWKLKQSSLIKKVFAAPGNPGTGKMKKIQNIEIDATDIDNLLAFAKKEKIHLTVVGSEASIALGIANRFNEEGLKILAPTKEEAILETSKERAKYLMKETFIPTASFEVFSDYHDALAHIVLRKYPLVIKADGLAQGKGVKVCSNDLEAICFLQDLMVKKVYGDAGKYVLIEEFLEGEEYSAHALYDGKGNIEMFPMSKDYPEFEGRVTGGMGAIAPVLTESSSFLDELRDLVVDPVVSRSTGLSAGCIYPGIMITPKGIRLLEFNMRFGDPEAQVLLPLMKTDFLEVLLACAENRLSEIKIEWHKNLYAVCVVLVSEGYPGEYKTGFPIRGIRKAECIRGVQVLHAGTVRKDNKIVTNGGRVLNIVGIGKTLSEARLLAYKGVDEIYFEGMQYRDDIGEVPTYQGT